MDADDIAKEVWVQGAFGPRDWYRPFCPRCGRATVNLSWQEDDWVAQPCGPCSRRSFAAQRSDTPSEPAHRKRCNRCAEEKTLVGAWCADCRDRSQWQMIVEAATANPRTEEQTVFLRDIAPHFAVWNRSLEKLEALGLPLSSTTSNFS